MPETLFPRRTLLAFSVNRGNGSPLPSVRCKPSNQQTLFNKKYHKIVHMDHAQAYLYCHSVSYKNIGGATSLPNDVSTQRGTGPRPTTN